jgi:hypothetical protein
LVLIVTKEIGTLRWVTHRKEINRDTVVGTDRNKRNRDTAVGTDRNKRNRDIS